MAFGAPRIQTQLHSAHYELARSRSENFEEHSFDVAPLQISREAPPVHGQERPRAGALVDRCWPN